MMIRRLYLLSLIAATLPLHADIAHANGTIASLLNQYKQSMVPVTATIINPSNQQVHSTYSYEVFQVGSNTLIFYPETQPDGTIPPALQVQGATYQSLPTTSLQTRNATIPTVQKHGTDSTQVTLATESTGSGFKLLVYKDQQLPTNS